MLKKVLKWGGLSMGAVVACVLAFVSTRYLAAGAEYEGRLEDLAPAEVSSVIRIDDVAKRHKEISAFVDEGLLDRPEFSKLEQSDLWQARVRKSLGQDLRTFRQKQLEEGLKKAEAQLRDAAGLALFKDVLGGELLLCTDTENDQSRFVALSRVSRKVRFYWQFAGFAPTFAPSGAGSPELSFDSGVMRVKLPPAKLAPEELEQAQPAEPRKSTELLVVLLDDVLVIGDSTRLVNATIKAHAGEQKGLSSNSRYKEAVALADKEEAKRYSVKLWMDLDRLRTQLKPVDKNGQMVSPVDAYNALPVSVIKLNYDVLGPINRIVEKDLDTRPFCAAFYGVDLSDAGAILFDQYLLADDERLSAAEYSHLRKTWALSAAKPGQLALFPEDLVTQVSYRQALDVINNEVLDEKARMSFIGDFTRVLQTIGAEEVVMGVAPRAYQPDVTEISGVPLPAFVFAFRVKNPTDDAAGQLLNGFLDNMLGRKPQNPGDPPRKVTRKVIEEILEGQRIFGFDYVGEDPNERGSHATRLTLQTKCGVVGEWLLITNSRELLRKSIATKGRMDAGLYKAAAALWRDLPAAANATIYIDFKRLAGFVDDPKLLKTIRDSKYNVNQIDGRNPGELRREICQSFGLDPNNEKNLTDARVTAEYDRRKQVWLETCRVEGDKYIAGIRNDLNGLTFFQDAAVFTTFEKNVLRTRGVIRIR